MIKVCDTIYAIDLAEQHVGETNKSAEYINHLFLQTTVSFRPIFRIAASIYQHLTTH